MMDYSSKFKAIGDPTRISILECLGSCGTDSCVLTAGEVCCGVTGQTTITPTVSHHIKELRNAGLIHVERSGRHMLCSLNKEAISELAKFLNSINESGGKNDCC